MKLYALLPTFLLAACATATTPAPEQTEQPPAAAADPSAEPAPQTPAVPEKNEQPAVKKSRTVADYMTEQEQEIRSVVERGVSRRRNILTIEIGGKASFRKERLSEKTETLLKKLAPIFARYDKTRISITGYSADTGKPSLNQLYSEKRADIASDILEQAAAIADVRIFVEGKGVLSDKIEIVLTPTFR